MSQQRHDAASASDRYPRFSKTEVEKMTRFSLIERWRAGDVMFRIGQPGLGMRVLLSGRARLSRRDGLGRTYTNVCGRPSVGINCLAADCMDHRHTAD
jgi:thioredoxin reductase (NADPH)